MVPDINQRSLHPDRVVGNLYLMYFFSMPYLSWRLAPPTLAMFFSLGCGFRWKR
jgi:hypothetical protein